MNAAGVLGNVAADRARRLAGRIRYVIQAVSRDGAGQVRVDQTGLHDCNSIFGIDAENPAHPREFNHDPTIDCERAAGKPCACAPRRKAHAFVCQEVQDVGRLFSRIGKHDCARRMFVLGQAVAFVNQQLIRLGKNVFFTNNFAQFFD